MKKIVKFLGIIIFSAFILLPLKTNAQEPEWSQTLDLNDSVVSSIAKVEDGVVVMQYEGTASASNLLIKYDFNGNKIWEIDNNYGYNIESVSDGFIVWSETKITKLNKDGHVIWNTNIEYKNDQVGGLGNKLIELNDGYIIGKTTIHDNSSNDLIKISLNGNVEKRISQRDLITQTYGFEGESYYILALGRSLDGNSLIMVGRSYYTGIDNLNISSISSDLTPQATYENSLLNYDTSVTDIFSYNIFNNVTETEQGYILTGKKAVTFNKDGKFQQIYNQAILELYNINNSLYGYVIEKSDNADYPYKTAIVKYDTSLKALERINLSIFINWNDMDYSYESNTGFPLIKNKTIYYVKDNSVNYMVLNTPMNWIYSRPWSSSLEKNTWSVRYFTESYGLVNYRFAVDDMKGPDNDNSNDNTSSIINNIIKNPQTNSIIIVAVFIALILAISITSYFIYRRKQKKKK